MSSSTLKNQNSATAAPPAGRVKPHSHPQFESQRKGEKRAEGPSRLDSQIIAAETSETVKPYLLGPQRDQLFRTPSDWAVILWIGLMHVGCLAAPFFFTWQAVVLCVVLHWLTASIGICLAYHRYLTHRSFKLKGPAHWFVVMCGVLSGEGTPLMWTANHRLHHQRSDKEGDPHSPLHGKWWSHILWLVPNQDRQRRDQLIYHYVPELAGDKVLWMFERTYGLWLIGSGVVLFLIGGLPFLLWGLCVRMTFAYHSTWFVNSATHLWGYRNYQTRDESRNLWWVALLAYGEGWHNNHHAHPTVAPAGHRWWEIDMTWWTIKFLRFIGQATDVQDRIPEREDKPTLAAAP